MFNQLLIRKILCQIASDNEMVDYPCIFSKDMWTPIVTTAIIEGMAGLLYWRIHANACFDKNVDMSTLISAFYQTTAKNAMFLDELEKLLIHFQRRNIVVMVIKGAALLQEIYPLPGLRPMSDVDILVHPEDLEQVLAICKSVNWKLEKITYHATLLGGSEQNIPLEIHWTLPGGYSCPDWFFNSEHWITAQLAYLVAHLGVHHPGQSRLIWLYDIHLYLMKHAESVNWSLLESLFFVLELENVLRGVLDQVHNYFDTPLPELDVFQAPIEIRPLLRTDQLIMQAFSKLSVISRFRRLVPLFFPSANYMQWRYNPKPWWVWPMYYPVRWFSLKEILFHRRH